jgi:predicted DNA-binding protein
MAKQLAATRVEPITKNRITKLIGAFGRDEAWVVRELIEIGLPELEQRAERFQQAMGSVQQGGA